MNKKIFGPIITNTIVGNELIRNVAAKRFDKMLYKEIAESKNPLYSKNVRQYQYYGYKALYRSFLRNFNRGIISSKVAKRIIETLVDLAIFRDRDNICTNFEKKYKQTPPNFITISPTKTCNLLCPGCYAISEKDNEQKLDWLTIDKIIQEMHDDFGIRFYVISGGEPLMYKSNGKTILDLLEKWNDCYFLMYTNGTLINENIAKKMGELGNITPAISVEGYEKQTDERRGKGIHKKILKAIENLKKQGVPFGMSVTVSKDNFDIMLEDDFYDYYFDKIGASYMWMFHYMPIGRKFSTELMLTPEQRFVLLKKLKPLLINKEYLVADFWNSAVLSNGCLAGGCAGGYFYINWDGNIMPCVFVPYYKHNVHNLFKENRKIADALFSDFFVKGREWQSKYFNQNGKMGNMLIPCFIRDHHKEFIKIANETNVMPENQAAKEAMEDLEYHKELINFDEKLKEIEEPYWEEEYS